MEDTWEPRSGQEPLRSEEPDANELGSNDTLLDQSKPFAETLRWLTTKQQDEQFEPSDFFVIIQRFITQNYCRRFGTTHVKNGPIAWRFRFWPLDLAPVRQRKSVRPLRSVEWGSNLIRSGRN